MDYYHGTVTKKHYTYFTMAETLSPPIAVNENPVIAQKDEGNAANPKQDRTLGLWAADGIIYPVINYGLVLGLSVGSLFLGRHGHEVGKHLDGLATDNPVIASLTHGVSSICHAWNDRTSNLVSGLSGAIGEQSAKALVTVGTSFIDGCAVLPLVLWLEKNKINVAKTIDRFAGTTPENDFPYEAEPVKTGADLVGGRAITALIVVPVAMALDNHWGLEKSLNEYVFYENGKKLGGWVKERFPEMVENFTEKQVETLSECSLFEVFYTMVCSVGLGVSSYVLAKHGEEKEEEKERKNTLDAQIRTPYTVVKKTAEEANYAPTWGGRLQPSTSHALAT